MVAKIIKTIELKFWDVLIPLLSNSDWLRMVVNKITAFSKNEKLLRKIVIVLLIAIAGFASGFLFFSLSSLLA